MNPKVIIIGAGASGYAAGVRLLQNGFKNITVLEAENRIGGRIHSVHFGENNVDLGAQWCHGETDNIVYNMVKDLNLLEPASYNYMEYTFVDSNGKFIDSNVTTMLTKIAFTVAEHEEEKQKNFNGSFGDFFIKRYNERVIEEGIDENIAGEILEWFHKFTNSINGSTNWFEVSAKGLTHYKECEGSLTLGWKKQGYNTIFDVLKKKIPDPTKELPIDEKIIFNKEVIKIIWESKENKNMTVLCKDGTEYIADFIILTSSLGFLKENYKTLFVPDLPLYKTIAIDNLAIGAVNKIFLKFKTRWWPETSNGFCFIWSSTDLVKEDLSDYGSLKTKDGKSWLESIFGFYPIDYNPNVLLGWVTGPLGPEIEKLSDELVLNGSMFLLQKFLGKHYKIPTAESILRSKWYTNNFFRGSYSHRSMDTEKYDTSAEKLSTPLVSGSTEKVLFAGEATHSHFYSTVHGAIESGFREADRIVKICKSSTNQNCKL